MKKYDNYKSHLRILQTSDQQDLGNEFIIGGIIDKFFIQFELSWKVMKELLTYDGVAAGRTGSPREIIKEAYRFYSCIDEDIWLEMLSQRNNMAHIYDSNAALELVHQIIDRYIPAFLTLEKGIDERYAEVLEKLP